MFKIKGICRFYKERVGDVKHSLAGIDKAKKIAYYQPLVNSNEGLKKTAEFF